MRVAPSAISEAGVPSERCTVYRWEGWLLGHPLRCEASPGISPL